MFYIRSTTYSYSHLNISQYTCQYNFASCNHCRYCGRRIKITFCYIHTRYTQIYMLRINWIEIFYTTKHFAKYSLKTSLIVCHHELSILKMIFYFSAQKLVAFLATILLFWSKWQCCEIQRNNDSCCRLWNLHKFCHLKWILPFIFGICRIKCRWFHCL